MDGICTLANDHVYDQLIALLNSIEAIYGHTMPVCIYPYDQHTIKIAAEIARRPYVQLYDDQNSLQQWDEFVRLVWDTHPTAQTHWLNINGDKYYRVGTHRRFCAFDGPFDRFVYMDADTLLMSPLDEIFARLDKHDWVVYDFQYKDISHVYDVSSSKLTELFTSEELQNKIFCSGFYGSKKDIFKTQKLEFFLEKLRQGEAEVLYAMAPDQTVLNYMVMRSGISFCNLSLQLTHEQTTGCCVTSPHFTSQDHILYDQGKRLTYLHYIGVKSRFFQQVCAGENVIFPYRDTFLHYRYLHQPNERPQFTTKPKAYNAPPSLGTKILRKFGFKN